MGCNLCTFQKREEHYKLLYEVSQVSAGPIPATKQPGFVFIWKVVNDFWLALVLSFNTFQDWGQICWFGAFSFGFRWQFSVSLPLPLQMTSCGILFNILCIYCQDVSQVRGAALRSMFVIFWEISLILEICWHLKTNCIFVCINIGI